MSSGDPKPPRFPVGERVWCNVGSWSPGKVVKHSYREDSWPVEKVVPYQVALDDGRKIFVPVDSDKVITNIEPESVRDDDDDGEQHVGDEDKIPVTIITGFLGAGKTTLVNHILTNKEGLRVAVIENEFGAVSIDNDLVNDQMRVDEEFQILDNGCACCTVRGDLVEAMKKMGAITPPFDALIIETTGLADPAPIAFSFQSDLEIQTKFRIDSILCVADAKNISTHLSEVRPDNTVNESVQQIAFADRILFNKIDLVSDEGKRAVLEEIQSINMFAEVIPCQNSIVALDKILGMNSFSVEKAMETDPAVYEDLHPETKTIAKECSEPGCTEDHDHAGHSHEHSHGHEHKEHGHTKDGHTKDCGTSCQEDHSHGGHSHAHSQKRKRHDISGVSSLGLSFEGLVNMEKFQTFMQDLLGKQAKDLYRSKGVLAIKGAGRQKFVFQGVHENINFAPALGEWPAGEKIVNKFVFIGRNLNHEELEAGLKDCVEKV